MRCTVFTYLELAVLVVVLSKKIIHKVKRSIKLRQFYWPVCVPWFISELLMLNQPPAGAVFAVPAANIHYPPPCRYKPFLSMAVQCYRDRLYGWLFPAWHHWWMAAVVTINMFPSHLKEPHGRVARVAHGLFPAVCPPFSLFAGHDCADVCQNDTHFASMAS